MRIIPRVDIKNNHVIKGINLEGLRKIGEPKKIIESYYNDNADEIFILDSVASLYSRNNLFSFIKDITKEVFVPITLGGGIKNLTDIEIALNSGADKVAINSGAVNNLNFIREASKEFGSSTIMVSIEAKKISEKKWEPYTNSGRERTNFDLIDWIKKVQNDGCGEIILTSIDYEGTEKGFDYNLLENVKRHVKRPLIISGGCGSINDIIKIKQEFESTSVAVASLLHYNKITISDIKKKLLI
jgi:cyclase